MLDSLEYSESGTASLAAAILDVDGHEMFELYWRGGVSVLTPPTQLSKHVWYSRYYREMSFNREVLVCSVVGAVGLTATAAGLCLLARKFYEVLIAVQI